MDRLAELKKDSSGASPSHISIQVNDPEMTSFFSEVEKVKTNIVNIKASTRRIEDIDQQVSLATNAEKEAEIR